MINLTKIILFSLVINRLNDNHYYLLLKVLLLKK